MEFLREQPDFDAASGHSPSYNEASAFLVNMRRAELQAVGGYNSVQINLIISQEAIGLASQALQAGRNPARVVLDVAKARGFTCKPKEAPAAQAPPETEQQRIARIAKGAGSWFPAARRPARRQTKGFDAKALANMSDDGFTAFLDKAKKSDLRGLVGD
jgi:hypothetical protein